VKIATSTLASICLFSACFTGSVIAQNLKGENKQKSAYQVYKNCRSEALKKFARPKQRPRMIKALRECKDRVPQAHEYDQCKKKALKDNMSDLKKAKLAILSCREVMQAKSFVTRDKLPLSRVGERLFFAGIDLDKSLKLKDIKENTPGFDCTLLRKAMEGVHPPEFVLFGNRPESFAKGDGQKAIESFYATLKKVPSISKNEKTPYKNIKGIGRVYRSENRAAVFFPTAYCLFKKKTGRFYEALKVYYLIDFNNKVATPFFGLSFYRKSKSIADGSYIVSKLKDELGNDYREFATQRGAVYLVQDEISEFDDEDDPFDVCREPRRHKIISVIKERKPSDQASMLMVVANIKNLCHFGDSRFASWSEKKQIKKRPKKSK
jgi:hypothetical protein